MRAIATLSLIAAIAILLAGCKTAIAPPEGPGAAAGTVPLPEISLLHYRVALAHLDNDPGGRVEARLRRALTDLDPSFAIQIVPYNATVSASPAESDVAAARTFLATSNAIQMIGGSVIAKSGRQLVRLVIVSPLDGGFANLFEPEYFRFPALAPDDNAVILQLAIANASVIYLGEGICGHAYWRLKPLIARARRLTDRTGADAYWDRDSSARMNFIVADAMRSSANIDGSESMLRRSLVYSLAAMADFAQTNSPHDSAIAGWRFAAALTEFGKWRDDRHDVSVSIDLLRQATELLEAEHDELNSAMAQDNVAFSLFLMPGIGGKKQRLEQALRIYQAVIARIPRDTYPESWQMEERNLAVTNSAIGDMEPGDEHLDESIAEFRALLAAPTQRDANRAVTESDFGHVLTKRAERGGESSNDDFKQAVTLERDALKSVAPCFPRLAGDAEDDLGIALLNLGVHQNSGDDITQAITAFNSALSKYALFGSRQQIARAETNLAEADRELASRTGGAADFEAAVKTQRAALRSISKKRDPLQWAKMEARLAESLRRWGDEQSNSGRLEEAIAADRDALTTITPEADLQTWRQAESDLGNGLNSLAMLEHGALAIDDAQAGLAAYQKVLSTFRKDTEPRGWATIEGEIGEALTTWGANESSADHLEQAVDALNQSLMLINPHNDPATWAYLQNDLGLALAILGEREAGTARLEQSASAFRQALTVLSKDKNDAQFKRTTDDLNDVLAELKKRGA